ncbi:MAG TPA: hypothetical protein VJG66_01325 [Patescibacteria group bacterium]|nr:hypothetical protein [Patescibacteria group bacterium]
MRRVEAVNQLFSVELKLPAEVSPGRIDVVSERLTRAGIVEISGFRSERRSIGAVRNSERAYKATIHDIRGERRSRGGGGRCRAAAEHTPDRCPGSRHHDRSGAKLRPESVNQSGERAQRSRAGRVEVPRRSSFAEGSSKSSAKAKPQAA